MVEFDVVAIPDEEYTSLLDDLVELEEVDVIAISREYDLTCSVELVVYPEIPERAVAQSVAWYARRFFTS